MPDLGLEMSLWFGLRKETETCRLPVNPSTALYVLMYEVRSDRDSLIFVGGPDRGRYASPCKEATGGKTMIHWIGAIDGELNGRRGKTNLNETVAHRYFALISKLRQVILKYSSLENTGMKSFVVPILTLATSAAAHSLKVHV